MIKNYLIYLVSILLVPNSLLFSQTPKKVLFEGFTQASCGPCASQNPAINAAIDSNLDKVVPIKYQTSWPGTDPMNAHNPSEVASRVSYYGVSGVPDRVVNGNTVNSLTQSIIDSEFTNDAKFTIDIDAEMNITLDTVFADITITSTEEVSLNNLVNRIAVVEKKIEFESAPGSNGEKSFSYVMKKFLDGTNGNSLPNSITNGQSFTFSHSWAHENVYEISELAVVAWVQQNGSRDVFQAEIADLNFTVEEALDASVADVKIIDDLYAQEAICKFELNPSIVIRNNGNDNLTSLKIRYKINESGTKVYNWTGDLMTFQSEVVTIPNVPFFHNDNGTNTIEITLADPNNGTDGVLENNTLVKEFSTAPNSSSNVRLDLSHDQYGDEITWELVNSSGSVLYSGGPYANSAGTKTEDFSLTNSDCYEFIIYDSFGDGQINGASGVKLTDTDNNVVLLENYAQYGSEGRFNFGVNAKDNETLIPDSADVLASIKNPEILNVFNVYPNPTNSFINVDVKTLNHQAVNVQLFDVMGRKIQEQTSIIESTNFNVNNLSEGIYFINVVQDGVSVATSKVVVQ